MYLPKGFLPGSIKWIVPARICIIDRVVVGIGIPIVALWIGGIRHNTIRANKPPHFRQVIPRIHVDQPDVICARIVVPVAGEAVVGLVRVVGRRRRGAEVTEWVIAGQRVRDVRAGGRAKGDYTAQMVGVGVVEHPGLRPYLRLDGDDLPGDTVGRACGVGSAAGWVLDLVIRKGRVEDRPVVAGGHDLVTISGSRLNVIIRSRCIQSTGNTFAI